MKQIAQAIKNRDALQLSLIAQSKPYKKSEQIPKKAIEVFNDLFKQLRATFPAMMSMIKDQEMLDELRRQWVKAIAENEIYHSDQIEAGMRMARKHEKPFLPSPGEFISWCKSESANLYGLPSASDLYDLVMTFRGRRFQFAKPEEYPWKSNAEYWLVTAVSSKMSSGHLTVNEAHKVCEHEIKKLTKKIDNGFSIPEPVPQVQKNVIASSPEVAKQHIAKIRAMLKASH
ncbi:MULTISPECIES: replication protein P [Pantoea]|uniref:Phage replication protein P n=1 Tax=Candidatus Pantoea floridensis TaxID=1938870 RepID=A0A286C039_9GAMM|nr:MULTISPECIES: replication protein P [Pantoea]PIF22220.1 phage replication protein P [Enterobacteriaceae bacterium JKS000233]PXW18497.1 phage replication protein P [Pantoea sp. JKS000250]SOD39727.1 phage replication protein P [Pantoea floridensis]